MPVSAVNLMQAFPGHESTVAAVAAYMRDNSLTPADVLAAYDDWLAARMAEMIPAGGQTKAGGQHLVQPRKRHRAGDSAEMPGACPRCGGIVYMEQLCHITSPHWRTQMACKNDGCDWHGLSVLPIDALLASGAANIKSNTKEG